MDAAGTHGNMRYRHGTTPLSIDPCMSDVHTAYVFTAKLRPDANDVGRMSIPSQRASPQITTAGVPTPEGRHMTNEHPNEIVTRYIADRRKNKVTALGTAPLPQEGAQ